MSSIAYWRRKDNYYRLLGNRCRSCEREFFPPVYRCRSCGSKELEEKEMPRRGRIVTYTILREPMKGFEDQVPLILAIVGLNNGVRVLGQIVDAHEDEVRIGAQVEAVFRVVREAGPAELFWYGYKFVLCEEGRVR